MRFVAATFPTMTAGYSGTPLVKKLGIKPGTPVWVLGAPADYLTTLGDLPDGALVRLEALDPAASAVTMEGASPFIHLFVTQMLELTDWLPRLKAALARDGMLWVSWPKRASGVATDVNENVIRDAALAVGLVDVKVCAVDEVWSGLKLVFRLKDR